MRPNKLPFAKPDLGEQEFAAVRRVLESGWITSGPETDAFEREFTSYVGCADAAAVNSATAALHLGLVALGIGPGDAVLVPAFTFTATAEIVTRAGAHPVLLDVDRNSYLVTAEIVQSYIERCRRRGDHWVTPDGHALKALICVHYGGRFCDLDALLSLCRDNKMELLQDAAHSFPARDKAGLIGSRGAVTAFSFYATKNLTTGEGGMITSDRPEIIERIRRMRLHGIETPAHRRAGWQYDVVEQGYKYNLSDIASALGRVQLRRSEEMWQKRKAIHDTYNEAFENIPGIKPCPNQEGSAFHLYTIEVLPDAETTRDALVKELESRNIGTGLHFIPLYRMTYYQNRYGRDFTDFPACEEIFASILSLPIYSAMTREDTLDVIRALQSALKGQIPR